MPSGTEVQKLAQKYGPGPVWAQISAMGATVGKCVCPWGRVLSKPEAQRRKENHRQAQPPPTRQEKTPQRAGQGNFGHGADLRKHPFQKLLQAAAAGYQWLYRGQNANVFEPK